MLGGKMSVNEGEHGCENGCKLVEKIGVKMGVKDVCELG